jgi:hypothetical protein
MWDMFASKVKFTAISVFTLIFVVCYLLLGLTLPGIPNDFKGILVYSKFVSYLTTYWLGLFLFLKFFGMCVWRVPGLAYLLNNYVGPDLRGGWKSNVQYVGGSGEVQSKEINFIIKMSLFDFSMVMTSESGYSSSHVVLSKL